MSQKQLIKVPIESEMQKSYLDYAMSVIISRALPDVRDGLKPVHRRILFSMSKLGLTPQEPFRKSATIVGDVIGKYHPHGDSAIYDSLVRMAQDFNLRYPLVEGHGNFGSVDGDPAAAYRYTEARMTSASIEMLADLDKNTVDFQDNYDASLREPEVLPSRLPNLLINGSTGIAVGMATNIPPHNLKEVVQALTKLIDNPDIETEKLLDIVKGPDFPTGGIIMGDRKCREAYKTGRSSITIRAKIAEEKRGKKTALIITEIPYQVNKTKLIEQIADGIKTGKITNVSDLRDESDRTGMRIVIELSANANPELVINQLYKYSTLQISYGIIMLALVNREPKLLTLREILEYYLMHRNEVVRRKATFDLKQATERAHILEGLIKAIDLIDEIIRIIRNSKDKKTAASSLCKTFDFSPDQSNAILEMQLQTLTGLHKNRLIKELESLRKIIAQLEKLLGSDLEIMLHIKKELVAISKKYGDERKTIISESKAEVFKAQDLIPQEKTIITLTENTFLKRQSMPQNSAIQSLPEINPEEIICRTTNHHSILMFSNLGKVYRTKAYEIPETQKNSRGTAPINIAPLSPGEKILTIFAAHDFKENFFFTFITKSGYIKKSSLSEYEALKKTKMSAIKLEEGDEVISVSSAGINETFEFLAVSSKGFCSIFHTNVLGDTPHKAKGTRFIKLEKDDFIKIIITDFSGKELVLITENGFGSRISIHQFRFAQKTGKKIEVIKLKKDSGSVAAAILAEKNDTAIIKSQGGLRTELQIKDLPTSGRNRSGELFLKLSAYDKISSLELIGQHQEF